MFGLRTDQGVHDAPKTFTDIKAGTLVSVRCRERGPIEDNHWGPRGCSACGDSRGLAATDSG